jgi:putative PIN family toxin of toxin-antitoxin system
MNKTRVVLDTNVIISSLLFGGSPRKLFQLVLKRRIVAVSSGFLLTELFETLTQKFAYPSEQLRLFERKIKKYFLIVRPKTQLHVVKDMPDNRVLEAAVEGECDYIVTGDKELLSLGVFRSILIVTIAQFLPNFQREVV